MKIKIVLQISDEISVLLIIALGFKWNPLRHWISTLDNHLKPGPHIGRKNSEHRLENMFFLKAVQLWLGQAWSPYGCNGRKHRCKHVADSVPSSFDTREHW